MLCDPHTVRKLATQTAKSNGTRDELKHIREFLAAEASSGEATYQRAQRAF
jgi:hypothetical protein